MALIRFLRDTLGRRLEIALPRTQTEINRVIEAHLAGDPRAFGRIVARYQSRLINFVYRMTGDRDRAEELVQDTFLRVHRHLHRFDRERNFSTWIYTIAANLARNELRRRGASPFIPTDASPWAAGPEQPAPEPEDQASRPDLEFDREEVAETVRQTVERLSRDHREVFVLRELEGKSYEEIAEIVNTSLGTVKSRLNRARHQFAELILRRVT
jgi:RNA polymerase sigma-70 factor (ECF subfamily)